MPQHSSGVVRWVAGCVVGLGVVISLTGCVDIDGPNRTPVAPHDIFERLNFTTHSMIVRKGSTLPLSLQATAIDGSTIPIPLDSVRWSSDDSSQVVVDSLGRVTGRNLTSNAVMVHAWYTYGYVTRHTAINVYVTASESAVSSIRMTALDSTRVGAGARVLLPRIRVDLLEGETPVQLDFLLPIDVPPGILVSYAPTGGPNHEPVHLIANSGTQFGNFWVTVSTNLFGVELRDSLQFTGTYPFLSAGGFTVITDETGEIHLFASSDAPFSQPCGLVAITIGFQRPVDIVFSDSSAPATGCDALPAEEITAQLGFLAFMFRGDYRGGNILGVQPNPDGWNFYYRRSKTRGEISWWIRDAATKETLLTGPPIKQGQLD